jgi:hypothetical protein
MSDLEEQKSGVSRRTVAKAMAWSVPAIAIAVPAPAYAASPCTPVITFSEDSCKCPGQSTNDPWGFKLGFCTTVGAGCEVEPGSTLQITGVFSNTGGPQGTALTPSAGTSLPINVPIPGCTDAIYEFTGTNSGNFLFVTYTIDGGAPQTSPNIPSPPQCDEIGEPCAEA